MQEIGLHGELLSALHAMYRDVRCRVRTPQGLTDSFESTWGVKQGCPLSPLLFNLYVDPLEEELLTEDATDEIDGTYLSLPGVPVPCLLFADDLVRTVLVHEGGTASHAWDVGALLTKDGADREHGQDEGCRLWGAAAEGQTGGGLLY
jgi:hypothetical protein